MRTYTHTCAPQRHKFIPIWPKLGGIRYVIVACVIVYDLLFMVYINLKQQQVVTKKENEEKEICFLPKGIENFRSKMITMYVL